MNTLRETSTKQEIASVLVATVKALIRDKFDHNSEEGSSVTIHEIPGFVFVITRRLFFPHREYHEIFFEEYSIQLWGKIGQTQITTMFSLDEGYAEKKVSISKKKFKGNRTLPF